MAPQNCNCLRIMQIYDVKCLLNTQLQVRGVTSKMGKKGQGVEMTNTSLQLFFSEIVMYFRLGLIE